MRVRTCAVVDVAIAVSFVSAQVDATTTAKRTCKIIPEDRAWPSTSIWNTFNNSLSGSLIKTVPIGSPCFSGPNFDATRCQFLKDNWQDISIYLPDSAAFQFSIFANNSCNPFLGPNGTCITGTYPEYAVNASSVDEIIKAVNFAKTHNIRLIVKNTGHDFMGRVAGHGALSIWTHNLNQFQFFDSYKDPWSSYHGPAFKAYAGTSDIQLYEGADARGYHIVGGECPTVGFVGGYVQGGGHSTLSSYKGMAADQVLSFEVITTTGQFVNASTTVNTDLFWALRGGGGGAYGIVWSVTVKAFHDVPVSVATFTFNSADNGDDKLWKGLEIYQRLTPSLTAQNAWILAVYSPGSISVPALIVPDTTLSQLTTAVTPLFKQFDSIGLVYNHTLNEYPGFLKAIRALPSFQNPPVNNAQTGGRLIPKALFSNETAFQGLQQIIKTLVNQSIVVEDVAFNANLIPGNDGNSAVFPEWRTTERLFIPQIFFVGSDSTSKLQADAKLLTSIDAQVSALLPQGMGAYLNEADPNDPNWKRDFYGSNYDRLLKIKNKYDPDQLLYGKISVGGDRWAVQADGRLCPV